MTNEDIKQMLEGFTQLSRGIFNNPNLYVPDEIAEKYNVSEEYRDNNKRGEKND